MIRSRRLALIAALSVLTISACGDPSQNNAEPTATTPTKAAPKVIRMNAQAGGTGAGRAATTEASAPAADMAMRIANWNYLAGPNLPALDGSGPSWFFAAGQTPSQDALAKIAGAFGVTGALVDVPAEEGGGWRIGPNDGTAPSVSVSTDGMLSWYFSPAWATQEQARPVVGCAEPILVDPMPAEQAPGAEGDGSGASGGSTGTAAPPADTMPAIAIDEPAPDCVMPEPEPPVNVPTKDEALAKAAAFMESIGYGAGTVELEAYADEWSSSVTAFVLLDGVRSPLSMYIGYGENGAVTWASGFLATPERGADYPMIGTTAGVKRLNDENDRWMTFGSPLARGGTEPAVEPAVVDETLVGGDAVAGSEVAEDPAVGAPEPFVDPGTIEEIEVVLTGVKQDMTMIWDLDNTVWLLPAYTFSDADGGMYTVNAVADEFMDVAEPEPLPAPEPLPTPAPEPLPPVDTVFPTPVVPAPDVPSTNPAEPAPADTVPAEPLPPVDEFTVTIDEAQVLVGLSEADAQSLAAENGWEVRVTRLDGEDMAVTMDLRFNRVNVSVEAGTITEILGLG